MSFLFNNCSTLKSIDFVSCPTDNVTNMKAMFQFCNKLENLDLTNFNSSKVTNMSRMFYFCNKLKQIKGINNFNTSNLTNMREMFQSCGELEYLDLTNFDISKVTDKELIFNGCNKLQIKGEEKFNKVQNEIKKDQPNSMNKKTSDEKSIKSNNSYHSRGNYYNNYYNNYVNESLNYSNYDKKEKHHCENCHKSLDSDRVFDFLGEDYCYTCYPDDD